MTPFERDGTEVEALLTDLYLERVLARRGTDRGPADADLDPALRHASDRLRRDLTRVHPSFRFEERLALRLAEAAAAAAPPGRGGRRRAASSSVPGRASDAGVTNDGFDPLADPDDERRELARPAADRRGADVRRDLDRRRGGVRGVALGPAGRGAARWSGPPAPCERPRRSAAAGARASARLTCRSSCRRSGRAATPTRPTSGRSARPARRCCSTSSSTRSSASARPAATTSGSRRRPGSPT